MRRIWTALVTFLAEVCRCDLAGIAGHGSLAVALPMDDASLKAATQRARATVGDFIGTLAHPKPGQADFSVKIELRDDGVAHYVWLKQVAFSGSDFSGTLGPDTSGMKDHRPGEAITIAAREISDWMYTEDKKLAGGFTLRAIRDKLCGRQRAAFEKSLWFALD